jgi:hypothetical protein
LLSAQTWPIFVVLFSALIANPSSAQSAGKFQDSVSKNARPNDVSSSLDSESTTTEDLPEERSGNGPNAEGRSRESARSAQVIGAAPSREMAPFSSWRVDVMINTLGAGIDVSTPLLPHLDVRGGGNFLAFGHDFDVDGLHYDARLQLGSGNLRLDWFPRRRNFHISPGILYFNNYVTAPSHVPAGATFELGDETFINSVDDPVHGEASLKFPRRVAPMLTFGFRNVLPGRHEHISVPIEFGAAFTGAPKMNVTLTGTACQQDGCFSFAENEEAQQSLRDEVRDINDTLSDIPVFPVLKIGFGYRF